MKLNIPALFIHLVGVTLLTLRFSLIWSTPAHAQTPGLDDLVHYTNNMDIGQQATHTFSFTLPEESAQINPTDYIKIVFDHYEEVSSPSAIVGTYAGTPIFSSDGNHNAFITGITVTPGAQITIYGTTAINPNVMLNLYVVFYVTEDYAGTIIKNIASINRPTLLDDRFLVTATVGNPYAALQIEGYAAPYTYVLFNEGLSTMGTGYTNYTGYFSRVFSGIWAGTHYLSFYGIDQEDRATSTISVVVDTPLYQLTTITNQLLSPTIEVDDVAIDLGEPVYATGSAYPGTTINLFSDSPLRSYATTSGYTGDWTYSLSDTDSYIPGDYLLYAMAQTGGGLQSLFSPAILFTVNSNTSGSGSACGAGVAQGDLNCDDSVDLTDFSILMYYWGTVSPAADTNSDGLVNLTDFSVMMYYWGS